MNNLKQNVSVILVLIVLVVITSLLPYKEVLECNSNSCLVERHYALKNSINKHYFNSADNLLVIYSRYGFPRIINLSDGVNIFDNSFLSDQEAENIISIIHNKNSNLKITKYWIGYKIENN